MKLYKGYHKFYCGVDLHGRSMYACVMDREGNVFYHRNMPNDPAAFLKAVEPFREDLCVAAESTFNWYWLADALRDAGIPFVLGHALYMRAIHGTKGKNDRIDSRKIAELVRSGMLPVGYAYPREGRALRDLLRRRLKMVRYRAQLQSHVRHVRSQYLAADLPRKLRRESPEAVLERFEEEPVKLSVQMDLEMMEVLTGKIATMEKRIRALARKERRPEIRLLRTVPGVGEILALTILYEMDTVDRFERRQDFCSYARLVKGQISSGGKLHGNKGARMGNPTLKWAFSEAAVQAVVHYPPIRAWWERMSTRCGKGKSFGILGHRLGRAVYAMLKKQESFDMKKFLSG